MSSDFAARAVLAVSAPSNDVLGHPLPQIWLILSFWGDNTITRVCFFMQGLKDDFPEVEGIKGVGCTSEDVTPQHVCAIPHLHQLQTRRLEGCRCLWPLASSMRSMWVPERCSMMNSTDNWQLTTSDATGQPGPMAGGDLESAFMLPAGGASDSQCCHRRTWPRGRRLWGQVQQRLSILWALHILRICKFKFSPVFRFGEHLS
jgi:hypothetical protein